MITNIIANTSAVAILTLSAQMSTDLVLPIVQGSVLASHSISLENRYPVKQVSDVFKDNILLNIKYLSGDVKSAKDINWDEIKKPAAIQFKLNPGETFAFHDDVLDQYKNTLVKTTQAHFNGEEGFKTDGYLFGDGVCHLASLIYWVAKDANLEASAPTNHDFMAIPEIAKEFGVSIYSNPFFKGSNARQNLYITNNKTKTITFKFEYDGTNLKVSALE